MRRKRCIPSPGQGLNLGLRDAWELALTLRDAAPDALGAAHTLSSYRRRRAPDRRGAILFTDALVRIFSNDVAPLAFVRGAGLALLECLLRQGGCLRAVSCWVSVWPWAFPRPQACSSDKGRR